MQKTTQREIRSQHPRRIDDKKKLIEQKSILDQKNMAIREVLSQIERGREEIKSNVVANVENLLMPILQKLELKGDSYHYVQLLKNNLKELTSSFGAKLSVKNSNLTPKEIEICNMIRNGITNKEISTLLNISKRTTEKHRTNIRKKLSVNKDHNLLTFLRTL
jgi:DNA-binding CsgD family transcriptional regulator